VAISSESKDRDLLIVGAGVGGLVLALALGRKGFRVTVVDRQPGPAAFPRGEIIQPNGLKVLDRLGLLSELLRRDVYLNKEVVFNQASGRHLCTIDYRTLPDPPAYSLVLLPEILQNLLLEKLAESPQIEVLFGVDFRSLLWKEGKISGATIVYQGKERTLCTPMVVGADGVRSAVRDAFKVHSRLYSYADGYLTGIVDRPPGFGSELRYYLGKRIIFGAFPVSKEKLYFFYMIPCSRLESFRRSEIDCFKKKILSLNPEVQRLMEGALKGISSWKEISFMRCFRVRCDRWTVNGGALLGDAAHAMNPHVAQGRNSAMEDGMVLAEVLESCFQKGNFSSDLLSAYEAARRPAVKTLQYLGDEMTWLWNTGWSPLVWARDRIFRTLDHDKELQSKILTTVSGVKMQPFSFSDRWRALHLWKRLHSVEEKTKNTE
jgi:2-polyprenyl-6-methoxyphenol hydroxylase-like FAD-dependent oxidoreductase